MNYNKYFNQAMKLIFQFEGSYVNDPNDPGGETKYGISKQAYPNLDIKNLTKEQAKEIYYKDYWLKSHCDKIIYPVNIMAFDTAVNMGKRTAIKLLQTAIKQQISQIVVDGLYGPKTHNYMLLCNKETLLIDYAFFRTKKYIYLTMRNKQLHKFLYGWTKRVYKVYKFCIEYYK